MKRNHPEKQEELIHSIRDILPEIVIQYDHDWWTTLEKEKEFQEM
jgi:hypothetical protein